jgi:hypothetical protein
MFVCRMNKYAEEKPDCIDDDMLFPSLDLVAWVWSPARASLSGSINGLSVDDRCTGTGPTPLDHASSPPNPVVAIQMA